MTSPKPLARTWLGVVTQACNPGCSWVRDWEDCGSKLDPTSKITNAKIEGMNQFGL
jgi:hypothetical protein